MPYTKGGPYTMSGNFIHTDANNIEDGIADAFDELESITANDGISAASSDGPFTLANFISYLSRMIKSITGKSHWYTAPATSIESLNTTMGGKAALAGATFTGTVNVSSGSLQKGGKDVIFAQTGLSGKFSAASSAPSSPADGDLWLDTSVTLS